MASKIQTQGKRATTLGGAKTHKATTGTSSGKINSIHTQGSSKSNGSPNLIGPHAYSLTTPSFSLSTSREYKDKYIDLLRMERKGRLQLGGSRRHSSCDDYGYDDYNYPKQKYCNSSGGSSLTPALIGAGLSLLQNSGIGNWIKNLFGGGKTNANCQTNAATPQAATATPATPCTQAQAAATPSTACPDSSGVISSLQNAKNSNNTQEVDDALKKGQTQSNTLQSAYDNATKVAKDAKDAAEKAKTKANQIGGCDGNGGQIETETNTLKQMNTDLEKLKSDKESAIAAAKAKGEDTTCIEQEYDKKITAKQQEIKDQEAKIAQLKKDWQAAIDEEHKQEGIQSQAESDANCAKTSKDQVDQLNTDLQKKLDELKDKPADTTIKG